MGLVWKGCVSEWGGRGGGMVQGERCIGTRNFLTEHKLTAVLRSPYSSSRTCPLTTPGQAKTMTASSSLPLPPPAEPVDPPPSPPAAAAAAVPSRLTEHRPASFRPVPTQSIRVRSLNL